MEGDALQPVIETLWRLTADREYPIARIWPATPAVYVQWNPTNVPLETLLIDSQLRSVFSACALTLEYHDWPSIPERFVVQVPLDASNRRTVENVTLELSLSRRDAAIAEVDYHRARALFECACQSARLVTADGATIDLAVELDEGGDGI